MTEGLMTGVAASERRTGKEGSAGFALGMLVFLALIVHVIDVFYLGWDRSWALPFAVGLYLLLAFAATPLFREKGSLFDLRLLFIHLGLSAFYIVVPAYLGILPDFHVAAGLNLLDWIGFLLALFPGWVIYLGAKMRLAWVYGWVTFWILGLVFLFIFTMGFNLSETGLEKFGGRPVVLEATNAWNYIIQKTGMVIENMWKALNLVQVIKQVANESGINYYVSEIDGRQEEPVGLLIKNVRLRDRQNYMGSPVVIWADIEGKSFTEEIFVQPFCRIEKVTEGTVEPAEFTIFGMYEKNFFSCTFEELPKAMTYNAIVGASFNFETWAYVTYTFVDQELKRQMEVQGRNINSELDISTMPRSVQTNGPIMLGMGTQIYQPILVDKVNNNRDTILGVTFQNRWTDGKVSSVDEFKMLVPEEFELTSCDRGPADPQSLIVETTDGYNHYRFSREDLGDLRLAFQSITCRMKIKDPATFLTGSQKVVRTFVTMAKYTYAWEKRISFNVKP